MIINAEEIKDAIPLEEVIGKYVDLKVNGTTMKGCCPFHDEKTPSFVVSKSKGIYKCFGCGVGGNNAVSFLMEKDKLTYPEALEKLAAMANMTVDYGSGDREEEKKKAAFDREQNSKLRKAMQVAVEFYQSQSKIDLEDDKATIAGKTYNAKTLQHWGIFTTGDYKLLSGGNVPLKGEMQQLGVIKASSKGDGFYDAFKDRLIFPLRDRDGIIGFSGRDLSNDVKAPKYYNSETNAIYHKEKHLFGYVENFKEIGKREIAYLVEGPTDVVMMWQAGIGNAVASCGTAFTLHQAKLLARITDKVVVLFDGDDAGQKAAFSAIDLLLQCQLQVWVLKLPEKMDPADYLALNTADEFKAYSDAHKEDGIEFKVNAAKGNGDPHDVAIATKTAGRLIAMLNDVQIREHYMSMVSKTFGIKAALIKTAVEDELSKTVEDKKRLTPEQEYQKTMYGIYINRNKYISPSWPYELSNFIVKPLFLVRKNDNSKRIFEIINEKGQSEILSVDSDDFITLAGFKKKTENLGNFLFYGKDEDYIKVKKMVYVAMDNVTPIEVLGFHPAGFYAWANGITKPDGTFVAIDEYGIVDYEGVKYFLPTFSSVGFHDANILDNEDEFEKCFKYVVPTPKLLHKEHVPMTVESWAKWFVKVFGNNGAVGIAYYFAAVHRDFLFARYDCFPHINLFGPAGSGKSYMARAMTSMFGLPMRPTHAVSGSVPGFFRRMAQSRNGLTWYEEYSEKVPPEKQEGFKNFFDGFGRTLAKLSSDNKTKNTPVYNACIISGQVLPSHDPALLERCITLFFQKVQATKKEMEDAEKFIEWGKAGYFSGITAQVHALRDHVIKGFDDKMEEVRDFISKMFKKEETPSTRVLNNFAMVVTIYSLISEKLDLPVRVPALIDFVYDRIIDQTNCVKGAEEISDWWNSIEFLLEKGELTDDYCKVELRKSVEYTDANGERQELVVEEPRNFLYIRMNHCYTKYQIHAKISGANRVLQRGTLEYYLKTQKAYLGTHKKKMGNTSTTVFVFDSAGILKNEFQNHSVQDGVQNVEISSNMQDHRPVDKNDLFDNPFNTNS